MNINHFIIKPQVENSSKQRRSTSPPDQASSGKSPPSTQLQQQQNAPHPEPSHKLTVTRPIEKSVESGGRHERIFGVMSVGESGSIVAASVTVSPKGSSDTSQLRENPVCPDQDPTVEHHRLEPAKSSSPTKESLKSFGTDYVSRMTVKANEHRLVSGSNRTPPAEHVKSRSDEAADTKSKGRYGSVWMTPQNQHSRTKSANFSSLVNDWSNREKSGADSKPAEAFSNVKPVKERPTTNQSTTTETLPDVDNQSSVLRSLQNAQQDERESKNYSRSGKDNYDLLWHSETTPRLQNNREAHAKPKNNAKFV